MFTCVNNFVIKIVITIEKVVIIDTSKVILNNIILSR